MIEGGPKSAEYTGLIHEMSEELKSLCSLDESVNATEGPDDASSFLLELSSFLKELGCPYNCFTTGKKDFKYLLVYIFKQFQFKMRQICRTDVSETSKQW